MIQQTGLLYKQKSTDFIAGASPLIIPEVLLSADWKEYVPRNEKQYKYATFDTMSCTTFSFLNEVETWVNWHLANDHFTIGQLETMRKLGFFADGKFNCSDRFTAIMSGTMSNGNYFQNVGDSVRKDGLLPDDILKFGGNSQAEYLDSKLITQEMKDTAKKILDILEISYEWTDVSTIPAALKQCPIWGAIPFEARHAVEIVNKSTYFDTYEPFLKELPTVRYAMKVIVTVKKQIVLENSVVLTREKGSAKQTLGTLVAKNGQSTFTCKTLELPWLQNAKNISCIPVGTYTVKWTKSWLFGKYTYQIMNVKNRSGIRIHVGNYYSDINGCIIVGNAFKDINKDNILDVINSKNTLTTFENFMNKKEFTLTIK